MTSEALHQVRAAYEVPIELLTSWLTGRQANTGDAYATDLALFTAWWQDRGLQPQSAVPADIDAFINGQVGPALAMITWRNRYETSDYHLLWSRAKGNRHRHQPRSLHDVDRLGKEHLAIREVIHGDASLPEPADV